MNVNGPNISAGLAARVTTAQQGHAAPPVVPKNRQPTVAPATDQYRSTPLPIIDAEYVDLYTPIRRPPEQQNQWRNLIVEEDTASIPQAAESGDDRRNQQLIARYGQQRNDLPSPGSFVNLIA